MREGLDASSATSQTRSGASPRCMAPVRIASWSRASEASAASRRRAASHRCAALMWSPPRRRRRAPARRRSCSSAGFSRARAAGSARRPTPERRAPAWRPGSAAAATVAGRRPRSTVSARSTTRADQLPLQGDGRLEIRAVRPEWPASGVAAAASRTLARGGGRATGGMETHWYNE